MHRGDKSGTTENFTDYLSKAAPERLDRRQGRRVADQGRRGGQRHLRRHRRGEGRQGTIGYADESQAGELGIANVKVGDTFVTPSAEAAAAVVANSEKVAGRGAVRPRLSTSTARPRRPTSTRSCWSATTSAACSTTTRPRPTLLKGFESYVISEEGQKAAADAAGQLADHRRTLADAAQKAVDAIKAA